MTLTTRTLRGAACAVGILAASVAFAGDLNPPAGAVAPTMKTLEEVEPRTPINTQNTPGDALSVYRITQPGSYYLTGDLPGADFKRTLAIESDAVTVDLMGFRVTGSTNSLGVVWVGGPFENIVIHDGVIEGPSLGPGVDASSALVNVRIERLSISNCTGGIFVATGATVRDCSIRASAPYGVQSPANTERIEVSGVVVAGSQRGIVLYGHNNLVLNCRVGDCSGNGIEVWEDSEIRSCVSQGNGAHGISAQWGCLVVDCTSSGNTHSGFVGARRTEFHRCLAHSNQVDGFNIVDDCDMINCTSNQNLRDGYRCNMRCRIAWSSAFTNGDDGIEFWTHGVAIGNMISGSTDSGIVTFGGGRIDSNTILGDGFGIDLNGTINTTVTRNDLTNCFISGLGPLVGPINDLTNPWTNFID